MGTSAIPWTDVTWPIIVGCSHASAGCASCWAEQRHAHRWAKPGQRFHDVITKTPQGWRWNGRVQFVEELLDWPLRQRKPMRIFVCPSGDLFHERVPLPWIVDVFEGMRRAPQHTFQILTKRAARLYAILGADSTGTLDREAPAHHSRLLRMLPLPNVWLGVSVEDQAAADARIPLLRATPAAVRFVSAEPLLGPLDLFTKHLHCEICRGSGVAHDLAAHSYGGPCVRPCSGILHTPSLDLVIIGCESGPGRRNQDGYEAHARALIHQGRTAGVKVFHKQMPVNGRVSTNPEEWAPEFRVQELPHGA